MEDLADLCRLDLSEGRAESLPLQAAGCAVPAAPIFQPRQRDSRFAPKLQEDRYEVPYPHAGSKMTWVKDDKLRRTRAAVQQVGQMDSHHHKVQKPVLLASLRLFELIFANVGRRLL